jgi:hypothetical protein
MGYIMSEVIRLIFPPSCTNRTLTTDYNKTMKIEIFIDLRRLIVLFAFCAFILCSYSPSKNTRKQQETLWFVFI